MAKTWMQEKGLPFARKCSRFREHLSVMTRETDRAFAAAIIESVRIPLIVVAEDLRIIAANDTFCSEYNHDSSLIENQPLLAIFSPGQSAPGLVTVIRQVASGRIQSTSLEITATFVNALFQQTVCMEIRSMGPPAAKLTLLSIENITSKTTAERAVLVQQEKLRQRAEDGERELDLTSRMLRIEAVGRAEAETALYASESALLRSREELRHLSASLMNAQDAERRRVSRELHDDLSQKVARLQFDLELLVQKLPFQDVPNARAQMQHVIEMAGTLSDDLRRVAHQLHPATLEHLGLTVALRSYTEEFSRSTAIPVKFTGIRVPRKVPMELASGIYRIVQEALRNVGKHASDCEAEVVLARDPRGLALFIRDNGEGFNVHEARAKGGLGLVSIEERVRLMEGKFSIESSPGCGVLLTILCPLAPGIL